MSAINESWMKSSQNYPCQRHHETLPQNDTKFYFNKGETGENFPFSSSSL